MFPADEPTEVTDQAGEDGHRHRATLLGQLVYVASSATLTTGEWSSPAVAGEPMRLSQPRRAARYQRASSTSSTAASVGSSAGSSGEATMSRGSTTMSTSGARKTAGYPPRSKWRIVARPKSTGVGPRSRLPVPYVALHLRACLRPSAEEEQQMEPGGRERGPHQSRMPGWRDRQCSGLWSVLYIFKGIILQAWNSFVTKVLY